MIEKEINSLQEYMQFIDLYKGQYYFRGQADVSWNVEPSIFRNNDALMQESSLLGLEGTSKVGDNAKEVLRLQHFSTATRLCDITVNPLVALYFVFDCDGKDDVPGCVYIYEKKNEIKFDSAEMGVLLSISAGELDTVSEIEDRLVRNGTPMKRADIENLITTNHLVEYSREFSWSNERAFLQGGTGIFWGFSIDGENIIPKGNLKVEELSGKVIIPSNSKQKIKAELEALGVNGKILYNRDKTSITVSK